LGVSSTTFASRGEIDAIARAVADPISQECAILIGRAVMGGTSAGAREPRIPPHAASRFAFNSRADESTHRRNY